MGGLPSSLPAPDLTTSEERDRMGTMKRKRIRIACKGAETVDLSRLQDFQGRLKRLTPANADKLKDEILKRGFSEPISIWRHKGNNYILNGHQRLRVLLDMKEEGYKVPAIPVVRVHAAGVQEAKQKVLALTSTYGEMTMEGLDEFMKEAGLGLEEVARSYRFPDIEREIETQVNRLGNDGEVDQDDAPDKPIKATTKLGNIYHLGKHRLLCGDATQIANGKLIMGDARADMVFTDAPYNVDYHGRGKETSGGMLNDNLSPQEFEAMLTKGFRTYKEATKVSAPFYVCHASSSQAIFERAMMSIGLQVKNQIIWNKLVASMGWGDYRWKHEPLFYATFGKKKVEFYGDRTEYTVWNESWNAKRAERAIKAIAVKQEKGQSTVWTIGREGNYKHPTQKPVELIENALFNSSKRDDIVLDFFAGAGSTMIAAEKSGRICYAMELDPIYCDVTVKRWEMFTGNKAVKL